MDFDPIISSKAEYKETMMKSKKERELRENKKSQIEQKLKKVKTTDTFYMLNKKRFNLEPEGSNRPSSVHEKILQSRKQAYLARSVVLKDMSTNTDLPFHFAEAPGSHKHSKNIDHDENEEQNEQDFSSRDSSPGKDLPGKKLGVTRQDDYLAEMDDPDSRAGSAKPKPKKKELAHLHIQDINEIAHEQQWLKEEGAIPKKSATAKEAPAGPLIPKPPAPAMNPSYIKPNSSQNADLKPKVEPPKETPKKEEGIPPPVIDSKPVKPPTPPGAEPKEPAKDQKSPSEQLVESKDPVKTDEFPSPQASPKEAKPETPKAPEKTPDPPKPADVKPAPTMAKIPMPPTKKPADKPAETNTEVKAAPKPAPKPAEPPKDNPKEETKPTPPPDSESKPGEDQFGIPKLSQNPFLSRNAALKNASPDPKQKPDGKGQLTDSTLSPDKSKGGIGPLNPPKSPRSTAVDDKINGLRSLWK